MLKSLLLCFFLMHGNLVVCAAPGGFSPHLGDLVSTEPLVLDGQRDITIAGYRIVSASGNCITLRNCHNVMIERCEFGPAVGEAVQLSSCTSITVSNCFAHEIRTGVYALNCQGIVVQDSSFRNVKGPMPRGQMVQFDKVTGTGNRVTSNTLVNEPGKSNPEDGISIYMSAGTPQEPLLVAKNRIFGGGPSPSGGGIMIGDSGGGNIIARHNILMDPGQYGVAVSGGRSIQLLNNIIYARQQPFTNVGLYVWNQSSGPCGDIVVRGNRVSWRSKDGAKSGSWNAGNCGEIPSWKENEWDAAIDPASLMR